MCEYDQFVLKIQDCFLIFGTISKSLKLQIKDITCMNNNNNKLIFVEDNVENFINRKFITYYLKYTLTKIIY